VLVAGVAQIALGLGQAWLAVRPPGQDLVVAELTLYNLGNAAVTGGTVVDRTWPVDVGGALLFVALALYLWSTRGARGGRAVFAYRSLVAFVLLSIPVGLVLARVAS
jgi:hypothetical protein